MSTHFFINKRSARYNQFWKPHFVNISTWILDRIVSWFLYTRQLLLFYERLMVYWKIEMVSILLFFINVNMSVLNSCYILYFFHIEYHDVCFKSQTIYYLGIIKTYWDIFFCSIYYFIRKLFTYIFKIWTFTNIKNKKIILT